MKAELIDSMGTDLTVVNAARVSFDKESCWAYDYTESMGGFKLNEGQHLSPKDTKLIKYLATHQHTSPFRHCFATFRVKAPIFVARQLVKHQVGMSWNEVSRRYVYSEPEFYWPDKWRKRAEDKKQGSSEAHINMEAEELSFGEANGTGDAVIGWFKEDVISLYNQLLEVGLAPEQARMILPQNVYTEWYWSGSLQAWAHMCNLRCKPDTQEETRMVAEIIDKECAKLWPVSWEALRG